MLATPTALLSCLRLPPPTALARPLSVSRLSALAAAVSCPNCAIANKGSTTAYRHASAAPSVPETDPDRKRRRQPKRRRRRGQRKRLVTLPAYTKDPARRAILFPTMEGDALEAHRAAAWEFWEGIGAPKNIVAPMVKASDFQFRMLSRRYGAELCFTPMMNARAFVRARDYVGRNYHTTDEDRPLFVQFAGDDAELIGEASLVVQDTCDAVDLNLGCPQHIARRGHYGSFLLDEPDLVVGIVEHLYSILSIPVTCKIRLLPDMDETIELCQRLEAAGCSVLTVHGRTRDQKAQNTGTADWDKIAILREAVGIPVVLNGSIRTVDDVGAAIDATGVAGVMTSEAVLENPAFFSGDLPTPENQDRLALEYLDLIDQYPEFEQEMTVVRAHVMKFLFTGLQVHTDLRLTIATTRSFEELREAVHLLIARREHEYTCDDPECETPHSLPVSWYDRHLLPDPHKEAEKRRIKLNHPSTTDEALEGASVCNLFGADY